jgi:hypothetical protein
MLFVFFICCLPLLTKKLRQSERHFSDRLSFLFTATYLAVTPDMNEWLKTGRQSIQRLESPHACYAELVK